MKISRVTRTRDQARSSYDRISKWYDLLAGRFEDPYRRAAIDRLRAAEGERILEIGFGTGHCLVDLARSVGASGRVAGIDLSGGMARIARCRVRKAGLADRVEIRTGDAAALPFAAESFDAVFMSFTLELFDTPEIPVVLRECRKVLRPGGRLAAAAMSREGKAGPMLRMYEWGHRLLPALVDCRPIYLRRALEEAGFEIREAATMPMWGLRTEVVLAARPATR